MFKKYFQKKKKLKQENDAQKIQIFSNFLLVVYNALSAMSVTEDTKKTMFTLYVDVFSISMDLSNRLLFTRALKDMYSTLKMVDNKISTNSIQIARELETLFRSEGSNR